MTAIESNYDPASANDSINQINKSMATAKIDVNVGLELIRELNKEFGKKETMTFVYIILFLFWLFREKTTGFLNRFFHCIKRKIFFGNKRSF